MENLKTIKKIYLFKNLEDIEITALLRCLSVKFIKFRERKRIAGRLDKIENIYIVLSGTIRESWYSDDGDLLTSVDYHEGDIIGLEYLSGTRKTYSGELIAIKETQVMSLDSFRFLTPCSNFCPRHTNLITNAFSYLSRQNIKLLNRVKEITMPTTKKKVMCYLSNIRSHVKSNSFDIPYNRQELANYLGVERSALSKELSDLQKDGYIKFHKNHFEILRLF